jgi:hypothetical protein
MFKEAEVIIDLKSMKITEPNSIIFHACERLVNDLKFATVLVDLFSGFGIIIEYYGWSEDGKQ